MVDCLFNSGSRVFNDVDNVDLLLDGNKLLRNSHNKHLSGRYIVLYGILNHRTSDIILPNHQELNQVKNLPCLNHHRNGMVPRRVRLYHIVSQS